MDTNCTPEQSLEAAKDISSTDDVNLVVASDYLHTCHPEKYPTRRDAAAAIKGCAVEDLPPELLADEKPAE